MNELSSEAKRLLHSGLSMLPIRPDGTKAPLLPWKDYQARYPTDEELGRWFASGHAGLGIIAGNVSGNLEILDFDAPETFAAWAAMTEELCPSLLLCLPLVATPTGGRHVYYRCPVVEGNQKLAQRLNAECRPQTLIETRGEGGYAIIPPSPPSCHPLNKPYVLLRGDLAAIPDITPEERSLLLHAARGFNTYVKPERIIAHSPARQFQPIGERPGDIFNAHAEWTDILQPHGWAQVGQHGEVTLWKRPGKQEQGVSATANHAGSGLLYVFSTNAWPFEAEAAYTKFSAYALLEHGGDFTAAARGLSLLGYGDRGTISKSSVNGPSELIRSAGGLRVRAVTPIDRRAIRTIVAREVPPWRR